ncbi:MAG: VapC toxin family PIN domain ribonuclease [Thiotrichaceae bacterium IS1]|nr:MAG: VapC toxin family PIN domain ribonuclease [Thiotrichaceae bacterium IS1]
MGLIVDTNVFIQGERRGQSIDGSPWQDYGDTFISVVTLSELLVGVHRADNESRRVRRAAFVEAILSRVTVLDFTSEIARVHANLYATLAQRGQLIGAHDLIIAATALRYGFPVLTSNLAEFQRVPGLQVWSLMP